MLYRPVMNGRWLLTRVVQYSFKFDSVITVHTSGLNLYFLTSNFFTIGSESN